MAHLAPLLAKAEAEGLVAGIGLEYSETTPTSAPERCVEANAANAGVTRARTTAVTGCAVSKPTVRAAQNRNLFWYRSGMADVLPTNEARARLNQIAAAFDRAGTTAEPVVFGSHRRPQAVIVPWELWRELAPVIEDALDLATARTRIKDAGPQRIDHSDVMAALDEARAGAGG